MNDETAVGAIDSFPYRHKVEEVMGKPLITVGLNDNLAHAASMMSQGKVSSLVVVDSEQKPQGIVTERDILKAVASRQEKALQMRIADFMTSPVATVLGDAFVYVAIGRMNHLNLRHLVAVDHQGRAIGMITVRGLLQLRSGDALAIGDEALTACDASGLKKVMSRLPELAAELRKENIEARNVVAVTGSVLGDITARAAQIAEKALIDEGAGKPPASYCVLLLGSGGRRESLFATDQDNAIIHNHPQDDHPWFAKLGEKMCDILNEAGIHYCNGGVMAKNSLWRHNLSGWKSLIENWLTKTEGEELLNVHIFVDFRPVEGDFALAQELRDFLISEAARSPRFLQAMTVAMPQVRPPLGILGQFLTKEGRLDIKTAGLLPLTAAVRILALKHAISATSTRERLFALEKGEFLPESESSYLGEAHELLLKAQISQQVQDLKAGIKASNRVDPKLLKDSEKGQLKEAFKRISSLNWAMHNSFSSM